MAAVLRVTFRQGLIVLMVLTVCLAFACNRNTLTDEKLYKLKSQGPQALDKLLAYLDGPQAKDMNPKLRLKAQGLACRWTQATGAYKQSAHHCWDLFSILKASPTPVVGEGKYAELLLSLGNHWMREHDTDKVAMVIHWLGRLFENMVTQGFTVDPKLKARTDRLKAMMLKETGQNTGAKAAFLAAIGWARAIEPPEHQLVAVLAVELAQVCVDMGNTHEAAAHFEEARRQWDVIGDIARHVQMTVKLAALDQGRDAPKDAMARLKADLHHCPAQPPGPPEPPNQSLATACTTLWSTIAQTALNLQDPGQADAAQAVAERWRGVTDLPPEELVP